MKKISILAMAATILCCFASKTFAQHELASNELLYHSVRVVQSNDLNPAFFPRKTSEYLSLPQFNTSFGLPLSYKEVGLKYDAATDKSYLNINELMQALGDGNNKFNFNTNINLIGFGINLGQYYVTFSTKLAMNATISVPTDVFKVISNMKGNNWVGKENAAQIASDDLLLFNSYMRVSLGAGYHFVSIPLTIGAHVNILDGILNINTDKTNIDIYATDQYYSSIIGDVNYHVRRAGFIDIDTNYKVNITDMPSNMGVTFDLGAAFELNDFEFSASLLDIGPGIHWKQNVINTTPRGTKIEFNGFDISNIIHGGSFDTNFAANFKDSVMRVVNAQNEVTGDFWYSIPTKLNLGASYTFCNEMLKAGFLFHGEWEKGLIRSGAGFNIPQNTFRYNTTLSLTANLLDWVEVMVGNSFVFDGGNTDLLNPGIGIVLTPLTAFQIYAVADYLSSFYLVESKTFNCTLGINLLFGSVRRPH